LNQDDAREALAAAAASRKASLVNFVLRGDVMSDADVTRFDLLESVATQVQADVWLEVDRILAKQFIPYDPSYQTSQAQVLVEDLGSIPALARVDELVRRGDVALDGGGAAIVAMAHAVGLGEGQVVAYRLKGPGIATRRSKGVRLLAPRDGVYVPVDDEILYYEPRFDAFTSGGLAYFVSSTLIQTRLDAPEKSRELAKLALARATAKVEIAGRAELEKAVMDDPTMRAKMAHIARLLASEPAYGKHLTTKRLVAFIDANPDYDIATVEESGQRVLLFDPSPQHRHQIPKLLADDYLRSELTQRRYEAGSKHRMGK
jgi:hypothetical protein